MPLPFLRPPSSPNSLSTNEWGTKRLASLLEAWLPLRTATQHARKAFSLGQAGRFVDDFFDCLPISSSPRVSRQRTLRNSTPSSLLSPGHRQQLTSCPRLRRRCCCCRCCYLRRNPTRTWSRSTTCRSSLPGRCCSTCCHSSWSSSTTRPWFMSAKCLFRGPYARCRLRAGDITCSSNGTRWRSCRSHASTSDFPSWTSAARPPSGEARGRRSHAVVGAVPVVRVAVAVVVLRHRDGWVELRVKFL